ncbi:aspartate aminotransferase-like enzyme [Paraburkholderia youngii]
MSNTPVTRIPGRNILAVPGPTNIPDAVQRAMVVSMEDHRSTKFPELAHGLLSDLKTLYRTADGQPFIFPSSGTGAWEAALTNTLSPGDRVLVPRFGQFSHLWADMAQRLGLDVEILDVDWGEGVPVERIGEILKADRQHAIRGILACHNETATGVTSDIRALRRVMDDAGHPALLFVDGVSSIGCIDFRMDEWGVDLAVTGSQKGLMLPAGLGILCVSQKALKMITQAKSRRCYFDLADMVRANATGYFPYTPALSLLYGLRAALDLLFDEGLDRVFARHHYLASGVRAAVAEGWGSGVVCKGAKVALGHGLGNRRAPRVQRRTGHRHGLSPLQPRARRRALEGRRQGIPHRPPRRPERTDADERDSGRGDGDARCRYRRLPGQRRGCSRAVLAHPHASRGRPRRQAGAAPCRRGLIAAVSMKSSGRGASDRNPSDHSMAGMTSCNTKSSFSTDRH